MKYIVNYTDGSSAVFKSEFEAMSMVDKHLRERYDSRVAWIGISEAYPVDNHRIPLGISCTITRT
jgi:hypothetical protein